ncbi:MULTISPECIES: zinc-binding dehydrogenase [Neobacillus]|uniref:Zinc-binding dehydrogenase n=1 Tax=Neobacillus rhizophilus TaxID=2833579 RepID=A0A942YW24_9BACI|nr:zinc-binding dehydrogenase [Neobacillus rhizophilus]MBS4214527.1 zinc-binding dehydrogenase [Neobacillus rhizophilus]MBU8918432.1 zinc-binding dehydrogenase [Bacillus sp. FJAT-29953]
MNAVVYTKYCTPDVLNYRGWKNRTVIYKNFKLSEIKEAFKCFEQGHAQGKVVITI